MGSDISIEDYRSLASSTFIVDDIRRNRIVDHNLKLTKNLLDHKYNCSSYQINESLINASKYDRPDMIVYLIKHKANINNVIDSFIVKYLKLKPENYPLLFTLHNICNLSKIVNVEELDIIIKNIKVELNRYFNTDIVNIIYYYATYNENLNS